MLTVNEHLQKNIAAILQTVQTIESFLRLHDTLSQDQALQLSFSCAEMALLSMAAADEIETAEPSTEKLVRKEAASALRQITIHLLNVQEWEHIENIKAYFSTISKHCAFLRKIIKLPEIREEAQPEADDLALIPLSDQIKDETVETPVSQQDGEDREAGLKAEIRALRETLATLVLERDDLLHVVCKEIEADYMRELGSVEAELYQAKCELRVLLRKMERMQASVNRREQVETRKIDEDLKAQYEEYQRVYKEFIRRGMEAANPRKRSRKAESKEAEAGAPQEGTDAKTDSQNQAEGSEEKRLKRVYRSIIKAMHPDLHPDQSEATKELFKRAISAYKDGDLKTLAEIAGAIAALPEEAAGDQEEVLSREKTRILIRIRNLKAEIHMIKTQFPYTKKEILEDPVRLAQEKEKLNASLLRAKQKAAIYKKRIAEMETKYGKPDDTAE